MLSPHASVRLKPFLTGTGDYGENLTFPLDNIFRITAKLGSDYKKPDAITRIEADNYKEIAYPLPVRDLLYVGPATERKLNGLGIYTIGQLAQCPVNCLTYKLGKMGTVLHTFANGKDPSPVKRTDYAATVKSVGNSATTPRDLVCDSEA